MDLAFDSINRQLYYVSGQEIRRRQIDTLNDDAFFSLGNRTVGNVGIAVDIQVVLVLFALIALSEISYIFHLHLFLLLAFTESLWNTQILF